MTNMYFLIPNSSKSGTVNDFITLFGPYLAYSYKNFHILSKNVILQTFFNLFLKWLPQNDIDGDQKIADEV